MAKQVAFYIDMTKCYGCKTCVISCKMFNKTPSEVSYRRVRNFNTENPVSMRFLSMSCNHCEKPACLEACPTGAYTKLDSGIVKQDHDKCIGCKMCIMACPYNAPQYDSEEGRTSKCNYCVDRYENGELPMCVQQCPAGALVAGELEELRSKYVGVQEFAGMPKASITNPSIIINPGEKTV